MQTTEAAQNICPSCGLANKPQYRFCLGCGGELQPTQVMTVPLTDATLREAAPKSALNERGETTEQHKLADLLSAAIDEQDKAPDVAGIDEWNASQVATTAGVSPSGSTRVCASCGHVSPAEFSFCGQCGSKLEAKAAAPAPHSAGKMTLIRADGSEGATFSLVTGRNVIGRSTGTPFDSDAYLSPEHAEITIEKTSATVRDLNSLNGVFIKITQEEELSDGDIFRIGQELLRFETIHKIERNVDGTEVLGSPNPGYWGRLGVVIAPTLDGSAFPLYGDAVLLGREHGDMQFPEDGYVSATHARLSFSEGHVRLTDLNSSNGTFLKLRQARVVSTGAFVLMGQQLFRLTLG